MERSIEPPARRRERDGRRPALTRGGRAARRPPTQVTVVCPGERAARGLRRLPGHAAGGRAAPARQDARRSCARSGSRRTASSSRPIRSTRCATRSRSSSRRSTRSSSRRTRSRAPAGCGGDVVERIRKVAGAVPVEHVVVDLTAGGRRGERARDRERDGRSASRCSTTIKERAARSPASFLIIAPQSDLQMAGHPDAERRLRRALAALRGAGIDAHGQIAHPDPYTAAMHAVQDERVDEIIVSTFPGQALGLAAQGRRRADPRRRRAAGRARRLRARAGGAPDGCARRTPRRTTTTARPPRTPARASTRACSGCSCSSRRRSCSSARSSRPTSSSASSTTRRTWPPEGFHLPVFVAGINTAILVTSSFTMHWALTSIKRGNRAGLRPGSCSRS